MAARPYYPQRRRGPVAQESLRNPGPARVVYARLVKEAPTGNGEVRAAEVIAACCLATDLRMGFPFEHGLHATLMAQRLAGLLGVDAETMSQTYFGRRALPVGLGLQGHGRADGPRHP